MEVNQLLSNKTLITISLLGLLLFSCNNNNPSKEHSHNISDDVEKNPIEAGLTTTVLNNGIIEEVLFIREDTIHVLKYNSLTNNIIHDEGRYIEMLYKEISKTEFILQVYSINYPDYIKNLLLFGYNKENQHTVLKQLESNNSIDEIQYTLPDSLSQEITMVQVCVVYADK